MNGDELLIARIASEINAELSNIMRLRDEYNEFILDEAKLEELASSFDNTVRSFSSEVTKFCETLKMM